MPPLTLIWRYAMHNLKTIEGKVRRILEKDEEARNDDMTLYLAVCNSCLKGAGAMPFAEVMAQHKYLGFHTIIYGHRMRGGDMFADLGKYQEADFWQEYPSVYLALEDGVRRYDVFAAYEAGVRSLVYRLDLEGREEELIQFGLDASVLDTGIVPAVDEKLLTLSTCTGNGYSKRWVVQAVLRETAEK